MRFLTHLRHAYKLTNLTYPRRNSLSYASAAVGGGQFNTRCCGSKSSGNSKFFKNRKIGNKSRRHLDKYKFASMHKRRSTNSSSNISPVAVISSSDQSQKFALIPINLFQGTSSDENAFQEALAILTLLRDNGRQIELFTDTCTKLKTLDREGRSEKSVDDRNSPILTEFEGHDEATSWVKKNKRIEMETDLNEDSAPQIPAVSFSTEIETKDSKNKLSVGLPAKIANDLKEIPVTGMQLAFEMDMTNVKDALLNPNNPPKLPLKSRKLEDSNLALTTDFRLDSIDTKTIPLHFNALIHGIVEVNPKKISHDRLKSLKVSQFNEYVTAIAANLCSTALQKGFPTDVCQKLYSTQTSDPSNDKTVNQLFKRYDQFRDEINTKSPQTTKPPSENALNATTSQGLVNNMSKKGANANQTKVEGESTEAGEVKNIENKQPDQANGLSLLDCKLYQESLEEAARKRKELAKPASACENIRNSPKSGVESESKLVSSFEEAETASKSKKQNYDNCKKVPKSGPETESKDLCKKPSYTSKSKCRSKDAGAKEPCKSSSSLKCGSKAETKSKKADSKEFKSKSTCGSSKIDSKNPSKKPAGSKEGKKPLSALKNSAKAELEENIESKEKKLSSSSKSGLAPDSEKKVTDSKNLSKKPTSPKFGSKFKSESKCGLKKIDSTSNTDSKPELKAKSEKSPESRDPCKNVSSSNEKMSEPKDPCMKLGRSKSEPKLKTSDDDTKPKYKMSCSESKLESKCVSKNLEAQKSSSDSKSKVLDKKSKQKSKYKCGKPTSGETRPKCKKLSPDLKCGSKKAVSKEICGESISVSKCASKSESQKTSSSSDAQKACKRAAKIKCASKEDNSKASPCESKPESKSKSKCGRPTGGDTRPKCGPKKTDPKDPYKFAASASKPDLKSECASSKLEDTSRASFSTSPCNSKDDSLVLPNESKPELKPKSKCGGGTKPDSGEPSKPESKSKLESPSKTSNSSKDDSQVSPCESKPHSKPKMKCGRPTGGDTRPKCKKSPSDSKCGSKKVDSEDASKPESKSSNSEDPSEKSSSASPCSSKSGSKRGDIKPKCPRKRLCRPCSPKRETHSLATLSRFFPAKLDTPSCYILTRNFSDKCSKTDNTPTSERSNEYRKETCSNYSWKDTRHRKKRQDKPKNCYPEETQEFCPDTACYRVYADISKEGGKMKQKKNPKENKVRKDEALCTVSTFCRPLLMPTRFYGEQTGHLSSNQEALIDAPYKITTRNHSMPEVSDNDVLVCVDSVALSESDIHMFETGAKNYPEITLGNEAAGVVQQIGRNVRNVGVGDHVVIETGIPCSICDICKTGHYNLCNQMTFKSCLSKFCTHPAAFCHKIGEDIPMEHAALVYQLALGCNACYRAGIKPNSNIAIIGSCAMSVCAAMCAQSMGAGNVSVMCGFESTQDIVGKFVTNKVHFFDNTTKEKTIVEMILSSLGTFPDIIINCSSCTKTMNAAIMALKPTGTCIIAGFHSECASFNIMDALMKEIRIMPSFRSKNMFPLAINLLESDRAPVDCLIANCCRWNELEGAFQLALSEGNTGPRKVIVQCQVGDGNGRKKDEA